MKITIIAVGALKEKFWKEAVSFYVKRIKSYAKIEIIELSDSNPNKFSSVDDLLKFESNLINNKLSKLEGPNTFIVSLCIEGKQLTSIEFSNKIDNLMVTGKSNIVFIVGASYGLHDYIKELSHYKLSFGKITMPHNIARVVLLEQIYRSFKILKNETYHK